MVSDLTNLAIAAGELTGLTDRRLFEFLDVSQSTWKRWKSGRSCPLGWRRRWMALIVAEPELFRAFICRELDPGSQSTFQAYLDLERSMSSI